LLFALSAAASAGPADADTPTGTLAMRLAALDDALPLALSGIALMAVDGSPITAAAATEFARWIALALAIAAAGGLLIRDSHGETRVFSIGIALLAAGVAAYRSGSALFFGFVCGLAWNVMGARVAEPAARDLQAIEPPLLVLLLVAAGARLDLTAGLAVVAVAYIALRAAGKIAGAVLIRRTLLRELPADIGSRLLAPGLVAVALAMDARHADGDAGWTATLLTIVAAGSIGSELLAALVRRRARPA
jgi:hypothetical protein